MTVLLVDSDKQALDREARCLAGRQSGMMVILHSSAGDAINLRCDTTSISSLPEAR